MTTKKEIIKEIEHYTVFHKLSKKDKSRLMRLRKQELQKILKTRKKELRSF